MQTGHVLANQHLKGVIEVCECERRLAGVTETVHCHYLAMKMAVKKGVIYFWL